MLFWLADNIGAVGVHRTVCTCFVNILTVSGVIVGHDRVVIIYCVVGNIIRRGVFGDHKDIGVCV